MNKESKETYFALLQNRPFTESLKKPHDGDTCFFCNEKMTGQVFEVHCGCNDGVGSRLAHANCVDKFEFEFYRENMENPACVGGKENAKLLKFVSYKGHKNAVSLPDAFFKANVPKALFWVPVSIFCKAW